MHRQICDISCDKADFTLEPAARTGSRVVLARGRTVLANLESCSLTSLATPLQTSTIQNSEPATSYLQSN